MGLEQVIPAHHCACGTEANTEMARKATVKKNPLKNNGVLFRLNPYAKTEKRNAQGIEPIDHVEERKAKRARRKAVAAAQRATSEFRQMKAERPTKAATPKTKKPM